MPEDVNRSIMVMLGLSWCLMYCEILVFHLILILSHAFLSHILLNLIKLLRVTNGITYKHTCCKHSNVAFGISVMKV